jgi:antitoxin PrlF
VIEGNEVKLVNASARDHQDPVLERFLSFLATNMAKNPGRLVPFPEALLIRARDLTAGIAIDHDEPIEDVTAL